MTVVRMANLNDAKAIARVHVDSWRETYPGLLPDEVLNGLSYEQREEYWRNTLADEAGKDYVYVAEDDDGEVLGFVSGGPERESGLPFAGEIYALYLLKEHHRKGLGTRLFLAAAEHLVNSGINSMMLWVHGESDTRGFYEAMGGKLADEKQAEIGGTMLILSAYGWPSLDILVSRLTGNLLSVRDRS